MWTWLFGEPLPNLGHDVTCLILYHAADLDYDTCCAARLTCKRIAKSLEKKQFIWCLKEGLRRVETYVTKNKHVFYGDERSAMNLIRTKHMFLPDDPCSFSYNIVDVDERKGRIRLYIRETIKGLGEGKCFSETLFSLCQKVHFQENFYYYFWPTQYFLVPVKSY